MSNRNQSVQPGDEKPARGRCAAAICFSWKVITCIVSHVTLVLLVVSYCVGGAYLFQHLEMDHEFEIKKGIQSMRTNLTDKIWRFSENSSYLSENDWVANVKRDLTNFEKQILTAMKTDGWDGDEDISKTQWTFAGSLFYSIIVITTIGYGHISPRTDWGKVTTIFYAIVGIPLMLLCLSNIGDVMATSFRFIYWRICCYVCTRTARSPRNRSRQRSVRGHRYSSRSQPPPMRRSMKNSPRQQNDVRMGGGLTHAYSDPELRTVYRNECDRDIYDDGSYRRTGRRMQNVPPHSPGHRGGDMSQANHHRMPTDDFYNNDRQAYYTQTLNRASRFSSRQQYRDRARDRHTIERERSIGNAKHNFNSIDNVQMGGPAQPQAKRTLSVRSVRSQNRLRRDEANCNSRDFHEVNRLSSHCRGRSMPPNRDRAKSVGPRIASHGHNEEADDEIIRRTPIISNRYAIEEMEHTSTKGAMRSKSMPRTSHARNSYTSGHNGAKPNHRHQQANFDPHHRQPPIYGDRLELPELGVLHMNSNGKPTCQSPKRYQYEETEFFDYVDEREFADDIYDGYHEYQSRQRNRKPRRERSGNSHKERLPPSPRIMSPMGFAVKRQIRRRPSYDYDDDSIYGEEWSDYYGDLSPKDRPVPIWLCVFLVISYILGGAALFAYWEQWSFLDSAYFCFITLTTIGFGDFVPAKGVKDESNQSIAYCSLYLLFGIALLAMSFNLVQEEFIANVKEVAKRLGILKDDDEDD